ASLECPPTRAVLFRGRNSSSPFQCCHRRDARLRRETCDVKPERSFHFFFVWRLTLEAGPLRMHDSTLTTHDSRSRQTMRTSSLSQLPGCLFYFPRHTYLYQIFSPILLHHILSRGSEQISHPCRSPDLLAENCNEQSQNHNLPVCTIHRAQ